MKYKASNQYGKLSLPELEAFEKSIGGIFPEEYRNYLLEHNGGRPGKTKVDFHEKGKENASIIHIMYGIHDGPGWSRLNNAIDCYKGRMPEELIPFASDPGGNQFLIGVQVGKESDGRIYFWAHEEENETQPYYGNISFIAGSWNEFIEALDFDSAKEEKEFDAKEERNTDLPIMAKYINIITPQHSIVDKLALYIILPEGFSKHPTATTVFADGSGASITLLKMPGYYADFINSNTAKSLKERDYIVEKKELFLINETEALYLETTQQTDKDKYFKKHILITGDINQTVMAIGAYPRGLESKEKNESIKRSLLSITIQK